MDCHAPSQLVGKLGVRWDVDGFETRGCHGEGSGLEKHRVCEDYSSLERQSGVRSGQARAGHAPKGRMGLVPTVRSFGVLLSPFPTAGPVSRLVLYRDFCHVFQDPL